MRLWHFSDDGDIGLFEPRPVRIPVERPEGQEWLNGPLVWAIDDVHSILYLFPRECPRIVVWPTSATLEEDRRAWLGDTAARAVAFVEHSWVERLSKATVHRYGMPPHTFEDTGDVGMWVSRAAVIPSSASCLSNLPAKLEEAGVELRIQDSLTPLRSIWKSSLHASGIRLRNAVGWGKPSWTHSKQVGSSPLT